MTEFVGKEKGVPIRQPSTANLMIDSADRNAYPLGSANSFTIQRKNSILNGFFTRIGLTELVLEWFEPNISPDNLVGLGINFDKLIINNNGEDIESHDAPQGFYTQAQLLNWVKDTLNENTEYTWTIDLSNAVVPQAGGQVLLEPNTPANIGLGGSVATKLGIAQTLKPVDNQGDPIFCYTADLRLYRYLDFISSQLTNNQSVKDASTATIVRDVLARWYMAYDQPPANDEYGFPILMGYEAFCLRRTFSPPKQIRWETNIPIGNLSFEVVVPDGTLALMKNNTNYLMTLQISEV